MPHLQAAVTNRTRSPLWLGSWLVVAWQLRGGGGRRPTTQSCRRRFRRSRRLPPRRRSASTQQSLRRRIGAAAKTGRRAPSASAFKLVGTVMAANSADSFALVRRTADSQLVSCAPATASRGLTVRAIESDSVVLAGVAHAVVIEADTAAAPASTVRPTRRCLCLYPAVLLPRRRSRPGREIQRPSGTDGAAAAPVHRSSLSGGDNHDNESQPDDGRPGHRGVVRRRRRRCRATSRPPRRRRTCRTFTPPRLCAPGPG
jgi:hypothetical protein